MARLWVHGTIRCETETPIGSGAVRVLRLMSDGAVLLAYRKRPGAALGCTWKRLVGVPRSDRETVERFRAYSQRCRVRMDGDAYRSVNPKDPPRAPRLRPLARPAEYPAPGDLSTQATQDRAEFARGLRAHVAAGTAAPVAQDMFPELPPAPPAPPAPPPVGANLDLWDAATFAPADGRD
jgi:hypothetical protein